MMVVHTSTSASPSHEREHDLLELALVHLAVADEHARLGHERAHALAHRVDRLHAVVHEEDLPAALQLAQDGLAHRAPRRSRPT